MSSDSQQPEKSEKRGAWIAVAWLKTFTQETHTHKCALTFADPGRDVRGDVHFNWDEDPWDGT